MQVSNCNIMNGYQKDAIGSEKISKHFFNLTLLGGPATGKSSIGRVMDGLPFESNTVASSGARYTISKSLRNNMEMRVRICDIAGQAFYDTIRSNYMIKSDGALVVYDITNYGSLEGTLDWIAQYTRANGRRKPPIVLIGNKLDLDDIREIRLSTIVSFLSRIRNDHELSANIVGHIEVSAKTGENVSGILTTLTGSIGHMS